MTLPTGWPKRDVTLDVRQLDEQAVGATATAVFEQTGSPWCVADGVLITPATIAKTSSSGVITASLPRTDAAAPAGRTWAVTVSVADKQVWRRVFELPAGAGPLNLAAAAPLAAHGQLHRVVASVNGQPPDDTGNVDGVGSVGPAGPAGPAGPPGGSLPLFNVETFGAVGDGTTDDYTAVKTAFDTMLASPVGGLVYFPRAVTYRVVATGRITADGTNTRALFPLPDRSPNLPKLTFGFLGVGDPAVTRSNPYSGGSAGMIATASVLRVDYDPAAYGWSGTDGLPCVVGGPDADLVGVDGNHFANLHAVMDRLIVRQPVDPSLCAVNLEAVSTCQIGQFRIDVDAVLDDVPEPTHPTGAGLLLPRSNNNVTIEVDSLLVEGHYTGVPVTELCDVQRGTAYRCKIGVVVPRSNSHPCDLGVINTQQCTWTIAGYDRTGAGPNLGVALADGTTVRIKRLRHEEFDYELDPAPWHYTPVYGAHLLAGASLRGAIEAWSRVNSGATAPTGTRTDLLANGGTGMSVIEYTGTTAATKVSTTHTPSNGGGGGGPSEFTIFGATDFGTTGFADTDVTIGTELLVTTLCQFEGIRWFRPTLADSGVVTGRIYALGSPGDPVAGTDVTFTLSGIGWQEARAATPVDLPVGTYKVAVYLPLGQYIAPADFWTTGPGAADIVSGPITAPNSAHANANAQNSYHSGGGLSYPDIESPTHAFYGADIIVGGTA